MKGYTLLIAFICLLSFTMAQASGKKNSLPQRLIAADYMHTRGEFNQAFKECVGAGRANEGLRADWQRQLLELKKDCDFQYIRFHALFLDDMGVYWEDKDGAHFNWQYIDALYDFLLEAGVKPFVELAFMPEQLKSGEQTIFWWRGNVTPPRSYERWGELVKNLALHLKERYGEEEVATWYFEVWNEPNLSGFFSGTIDEYFKLYETSAHAIKEVSSHFRVGGPATAGCAWISEIIDYCKAKSVPLDFVSTHHYGVEGFLDEFGQNQLRFSSNPECVSGLVNIVCNNVKQSVYPNLEIHFTEWSSSYSPRDPIHDTYQNASFVLNTLKHVGGNVNSMSYWTFTDIFEEAGVPNIPFHGGFGLMNLQNIKKPTYFVYQFLNELGNTELVNTDANSWICKDGKANIQALFWNTTMLDQKKESNQVFYKRNIPSKELEAVTLKLSSLEAGKYIREVYRVGYKFNDAYTTYYEMGSPTQLTKKQVESLKKMCNGDPQERTVISIDDGFYQEDFIIRENDIYFVKLMKL